MSQQNGRPENGRKGKPGEGITRRAGRQGTGAASFSMSIVPHLGSSVNAQPVELSGPALQAELRRVERLYQAAILDDDHDGALERQKHYYALEQLRRRELRVQLTTLRLEEMERNEADFERRLSALEAQHGL